MSEMVDRVAAVIAAEIMELTADQRAIFQFPDDANGDTCDRARSAAVLVLEAMREPTNDMIGAGAMETGVESYTMMCGYQAMIDEALK